jgi:hypothetical protein
MRPRILGDNLVRGLLVRLASWASECIAADGCFLLLQPMATMLTHLRLECGHLLRELGSAVRH